MAMERVSRMWLRWGIFSGIVTFLFWIWSYVYTGQLVSVETPAMNLMIWDNPVFRMPIPLTRLYADPLIVGFFLVPMIRLIIWDPDDHRGNDLPINIGSTIGLVLSFISGLFHYILEVVMLLAVALLVLVVVVIVIILICMLVGSIIQRAVDFVRFLNADSGALID